MRAKKSIAAPTTATAVNVPATAPLLSQNPVLPLLSLLEVLLGAALLVRDGDAPTTTVLVTSVPPVSVVIAMLVEDSVLA